MAVLAGPSLEAAAQQADQPAKRQTPQKPPAKPRATTAPKQAATPPAAKAEALPPSQIGIGTLAKQAFMVDPQTSTVLLFKDADKPMHPSSMAKMMTIYILFEELEAGRVKLDTRFRVSERARNMGGSRMFVELGSEVTVEDLIKGMIVLSGNDACVVVAEGLSGNEDSFAERMTKRGRELGMTGTVFKNASGWPAEGQWTTARDLAVVAWRTIEDFPKLYRYYAETNWTYNNIKQDNRNRLLKMTAGTDGLKTGHTEEGGFGQATSALRDGRRLILVVNGLGSMAERAQETARVMEWGFREFVQHHGLPRRRHRRRGAGLAGRPGQGAAGRGAARPDHRADRPGGDAARGRALRRTAGRADRQGNQGRHRRRDPARRPRDRLSARGRRRRGAHGRGRPRDGDDPALSVRLAVVVTAASAGRFITLEGGEGAGKSTQIARLKGWLEGRGRTVVATREPGGSPGAEMIRKLLVEGPVERWDGTTEALLHFAARREHLRSIVWPALARGDWVVSDRFADSTLAYQGYGHGVDRRIFDELYKVAVGDFRPDLTLVLDLPIETGLLRAAARRGAETRYESLPRDFHARVRAGFLEIAKGDPKRCVVIDATGDIDTIAAAIARAASERLGA